MPEPVKDRCVKAHEYIFLLSKSEMYHYDHEAVKEDAFKGSSGSYFNKGKTAVHQMGRSSDKERIEDGKRNLRSVWTFSTGSCNSVHYAVFPPKLIEPCILAGCPDGGIVLDPFFGSGTTGMVATNLGRNWVGIEINPDYIENLVKKRTAQKGFHEAL